MKELKLYHDSKMGPWKYIRMRATCVHIILTESFITKI